MAKQQRAPVLHSWVVLLTLGIYRVSGQIALSDRSILSLLYERPGEPIISPKGENQNIMFELPSAYLPQEFNNVTLASRFGGTTVRVPERTLPDMSLPEQLGKTQPFSLFLPYHRQMAARLIEVFVGMKTYEDFVTALFYARARMNPQLVSYAQSVAILHRPDTKNEALPNFASINPDRFVGGPGMIHQLRQSAALFTKEERAQNPIPIEIPRDYTGTNVDIEHRVAYFREDVGINLHHWHWHLVYPFEGPPQIINKNRRGELFYYLHQQIIARYNFERLTNQMSRVRRLANWREPIEEGYFPKLDSLLSSRVWPSRSSNARMWDLDRPVERVQIDIHDLERWRERIFEAIHDGRVVNTTGTRIPLDIRNGIDILGNILEASDLSVNPNLYGNLHNMGHNIISFCHDPDHRHLENFGVMGDSGTAMRDPVFYRWHAFIDDMFQEYKRTLPAYTSQELGYENVRVTSVEVRSNNEKTPNVLHTFWQQSDLDLSRGLDFAPRGPVVVRITHLQHRPFTYTIKVQNTGKARVGTVRIFLAPSFDERNYQLLFNDQRVLFIELDKFPVQLKAGENTITRQSTLSSVTIPYERTFRNLDRNRPTNNTASEERFNFCGCGWPQHMLIPKGTPQGYRADLFVMVTNNADDKVQIQKGMCTEGHSYCGVRGQPYPDLRPMGFPFDRNSGSANLNIFISSFANMRVAKVQIRHTD